MASFQKNKQNRWLLQAIATTLPVFCKKKFDRSLNAYETKPSGRNSGWQFNQNFFFFFLVTGRQRNSCSFYQVQSCKRCCHSKLKAINQINENFLLPSAIERPIGPNCKEKTIDITCLSSRAQLFVP
ncbi:hypothetical protein ACB098_12G162800 [Castanea mollissima]